MSRRIGAVNQQEARPVAIAPSVEGQHVTELRKAAKVCLQVDRQLFASLDEVMARGTLELERGDRSHLRIVSPDEAFDESCGCSSPSRPRIDGGRFKAIRSVDQYFGALKVRYLRDLATSYPDLDDKIRDSEDACERSNRRAWAGNVGDSVRLDPLLEDVVADYLIANEPDVPGGVRKRWIENNLRLIKRFGGVGVEPIPARHFRELERLVTQGIRRGERPEIVMKQLEELEGVTERRAEAIARDQVVKYNGRMTEIRHKGIGVVSYFWRTVGDGRVRPRHAARNNVEFFYDRPPSQEKIDGHPGQPVQCRCWAHANIRRALGVDNMESHPPAHFFKAA